MTEIRIGRRRIDVPTTLADRVVGWFSPQAYMARLRARTALALSTGGYEGGKRSRRGTKFWRPAEGSANADIVPDLPDLRARSRDLERNTPVATGAISMQVNSVVGDGLVLHPSIDRDALGLSPEQAEAWERQAAREWGLFCKSVDFTRVQQFSEMQQLAFLSTLQSGDVLALRRYRKDRGAVYGTRLQLVEADRLLNENRQADSPTLVAGVEFNPDGVVQNYHIADQHPYELRRKQLTWRKVPARDGQGRQLVIHLFDRRRPDQARGVPYLAPVIEELKKLGDYSDSEVTAALVSSMYTVFITSGADDNSATGTADSLAGERATDEGLDDDELKIGPGAVLTLGEGEKIETANPGRPNANFDPFVMAVLRQVGVALDLPFELLIRHFTASYSASRAAVEMAWQFFRRRRQWLARNFNAIVYEWFMEEAVATGRLSAPGFFADDVIRCAWLGAEWIGPARMSIDPLKDSNADKQDIEMGVKTRDQVCVERTGGSFERKHDQLVKEDRLRRDAGMGTASAGNADDAGEEPDEDPDEDDAREERETG